MKIFKEKKNKVNFILLCSKTVKGSLVQLLPYLPVEIEEQYEDNAIGMMNVAIMFT